MVKCRDCGLLAVRHLPTRELREAELEWRERFTDVRGDMREHYGHSCLCFARQMRFSADSEAQLAEISEVRICGRFIEWQQGFTPKEHVEMDIHERQDMRFDELRRQQHSQMVTTLIAAAVISGVISLIGAITSAGLGLIGLLLK